MSGPGPTPALTSPIVATTINKVENIIDIVRIRPHQGTALIKAKRVGPRQIVVVSGTAAWMTSQSEPSAVSMPDLRFSIRDFMIAIAMIAAVLALHADFRLPAVVPALANFTAWWLLSRGYRCMAGVCFWCLAIPANILITASVRLSLGVFFALLGLCLILPAIVGFGVAWAILATRSVGFPRRSGWVAWVPVITPIVLPGSDGLDRLAVSSRIPDGAAGPRVSGRTRSRPGKPSDLALGRHVPYRQLGRQSRHGDCCSDHRPEPGRTVRLCPGRR